MSGLVKNYKITDGGYKNNADTVYGELKDGTYFAYYPEMDLVEVYDCPVDELIDILYYNTTHEDELSEEEYQEKYNAFFENHNIDTVTDGPLYDELQSIYYGEDLEESKKVKTEARGSRNEISTSFSVDRDNPLWIKGTCRYLNKEYIVNAKVFLEGSEYGINEGPVSKLWIQSQEDKEVIVNYDRGWDVEPKDSTMQQMMDLVIASVEHFRKEHPYEVDDDELEESKNKEKKEEYIERGFSGDPFDKHDFKDLADLEEYIIDHGYELLNDGYIEPNATTVEVFDPAGNDGEVYVYDIEESANGVKIKMNSKDSFNMFNMNESKKVDREKLTESDKHIVWSTVPEEVTDINDSDFREWLNINAYDIDDEIYKSASAEHMGEDPTAEDLKYAEEEVLENYLEQYNELISEQVLEDWESNIEPLIEEQLCKEDLLILLGTAQTWNRTGDAGRVVRSMKELRELMSNYDIEMIVDADNNLSMEMIHHDGTHKMGLYTFNEDYEGLFNKLKELDPEEFGDYEDYEDASDMYYDEDYVEYAVDNGYQAELREFLIPIKWDI